MKLSDTERTDFPIAASPAPSGPGMLLSRPGPSRIDGRKHGTGSHFWERDGQHYVKGWTPGVTVCPIAHTVRRRAKGNTARPNRMDLNTARFAKNATS